MDNSIDNPFAVALVYYHNYNRKKIVETDILSKIARKYGKTPTKLLSDLRIKYGNQVPMSCTSRQVVASCCGLDIPQIFQALLPSNVPMDIYCAALDPSSEQFNPEEALEKKILITKVASSIIYDNLSKLKYLTTGTSRGSNICTPLPQQAKSSAQTDLSQLGQPKDKSAIHIIHRIAQDTIESSQSLGQRPLSLSNHSNHHYGLDSKRVAEDGAQFVNLTDDKMASSVYDSPFRLIYSIMLSKAKGRVTIRRNPK